MKLDTRALRYLTSDDWRVLTAVEQGSKNHELVPTPLIANLAGLRGGTSGLHRSISVLAKAGLIAKVKNAKYDGYRLTYGGLDHLALHTHLLTSHLDALGAQIGIGKESDIFLARTPAGQPCVLKLHRLGRVSFRAVKETRDYLPSRRRGRHDDARTPDAAGSWMHLSRLAAQREFGVLRALWREGFPVPQPLAWSRHSVVMEWVDAFPLRMVERVPEPGVLYAELMGLVVGLAGRGLIHGDFNEFNVLIKEQRDEEEDAEKERGVDEAKNEAVDTSDLQDKIPQDQDDAPHARMGKGSKSQRGTKTGKTKLTPVLIDFPQTLSTRHTNAKMYFDRDVECVRRFFERRWGFMSDAPVPRFEDATQEENRAGEERLDGEVEAAGWRRKGASGEFELDVETARGELEHEAPAEESPDSDGSEDVEDDAHETFPDEAAAAFLAEELRASLRLARSADPSLMTPLSYEPQQQTSEDLVAREGGAGIGTPLLQPLHSLDLGKKGQDCQGDGKVRKKKAGWAI